MIVINEIPDIEEDRAAGKLTLVARFGKQAGIKLYIASWVCTYGVIVGSVVLRLIPVFALATLISTPLVYQSIKTLRIHRDNPILLAPANLAMIEAHSLTSFGLIAGYATQGLIRGADVLPLAFVLGALAVAYAPVAVALAGQARKKS
jgi:1,4-dihydroxy-2-naphthoate polyprenyltransferase